MKNLWVSCLVFVLHIYPLNLDIGHPDGVFGVDELALLDDDATLLLIQWLWFVVIFGFSLS